MELFLSFQGDSLVMRCEDSTQDRDEITMVTFFLLSYKLWSCYKFNSSFFSRFTSGVAFSYSREDSPSEKKCVLTMYTTTLRLNWKSVKVL